MNEREALKLALEALDCICSPLYVREIEKIGSAMKAIREALAQPEHDPDDLTIAYMAGFYDGKNKDAPQPNSEQKPVAWKLESAQAIWFERTDPEAASELPPDVTMTPLYTTPPKRKWVGLTGPEVDEAYKSVSNKEWAIGGLDDARVFFCAIEAKLREKNGC